MLNQTTFEAALKYHYGPQTLKEIAYKQRPLLAMMAKMDNFGGRSLPLPLSYGNVRNRAAGFQEAQRSVSGTSLDFDASSQLEFLLTRVKNYAVGRIEGETVRASQGDVNAFASAVEHEMRKATEALSDDTHHDCYTDGISSIGDAVTVSGTTVTLSDRAFASRVQAGDYIEFSTATRIAALRASGPAKVTAVDPIAGTLTLASNPASGVTGDFIFHYGDRPAAAIVATTNAAHLKMAGVDGWVRDDTIPASDSFFGADRTPDQWRLGGGSFDGSASSNEEAFVDAQMELSTIAGRGCGELSFAHPRNVGALIKELGSKKEYESVRDPEGIVGFRSLVIVTPSGETKVISDHACPVNKARMLTMETFKLYSAGGILKLLDFDGQRILRLNDNDQYEFRLGQYANIGCDAPGKNLLLTLPTVA